MHAKCGFSSLRRAVPDNGARGKSMGKDKTILFVISVDFHFKYSNEDVDNAQERIHAENRI